MKAALAVAAVSLLCLPEWRDSWIYFEYQNGRTKSVTSECISISVDRTNEPRRYSFFTIYSFHLKCGTTVAVYKDIADQLLPSDKVPEQLQALEQQFITGRPITVTYVAGMPMVNDTYALVSASDCEGVLVSASLGIAHYSERVRTIAITSCVLYGVALLFLAAPLIPYMCRKWRHRKNRIRKKRKKRNSQQRHEQNKQP